MRRFPYAYSVQLTAGNSKAKSKKPISWNSLNIRYRLKPPQSSFQISMCFINMLYKYLLHLCDSVNVGCGSNLFKGTLACDGFSLIRSHLGEWFFFRIFFLGGGGRRSKMGSIYSMSFGISGEYGRIVFLGIWTNKQKPNPILLSLKKSVLPHTIFYISAKLHSAPSAYV